MLSVPVVGDAMARPLIDEIERGDYDLSSLASVTNGGAPLTPTVKQRLIDGAAQRPADRRRRVVGDRRADDHCRRPGRGRPASSTRGPTPRRGRRPTQPRAEAGRRRTRAGWPSADLVPLGYQGDAAKTAKTFPVIDGVRYSVPGDRARLPRRRPHRTARPRLGDHQLRRREDLRRGGRARDRGAPAVSDVVVVGPAERALGPRGRRGRPARRGQVGKRRRARRDAARPSPATRCPRRSSAPTRSSAGPPARPTTAGPRTSRSRASAEITRPPADDGPSPAASAR